MRDRKRGRAKGRPFAVEGTGADLEWEVEKTERRRRNGVMNGRREEEGG